MLGILADRLLALFPASLHDINGVNVRMQGILTDHLLAWFPASLHDITGVKVRMFGILADRLLARFPASFHNITSVSVRMLGILADRLLALFPASLHDMMGVPVRIHGTLTDYIQEKFYFVGGTGSADILFQLLVRLLGRQSKGFQHQPILFCDVHNSPFCLGVSTSYTLRIEPFRSSRYDFKFLLLL